MARNTADGTSQKTDHKNRSFWFGVEAISWLAALILWKSCGTKGNTETRWQSERSIVTRAKTGKNWLASSRVAALIDIRQEGGACAVGSRACTIRGRSTALSCCGPTSTGSDGRTALKIEADWPIGRKKIRQRRKVGRSVRKWQW